MPIVAEQASGVSTERGQTHSRDAVLNAALPAKERGEITEDHHFYFWHLLATPRALHRGNWKGSKKAVYGEAAPLFCDPVSLGGL